ncbi:hypothetical protein EDD57_1654 [Baia soyae]|uniref:Uncharacterized protein n=1 Tax=Baia soyae TaxID=1544746 RepID=A0A4R2RFG1_9BACL|nr:hypothetical protein EDD57_1654 [Baia soyae]
MNKAKKLIITGIAAATLVLPFPTLLLLPLL